MLIVRILVVALTAGCATMHKSDRETGLEIEYNGSARGASRLIHATDRRPYALASDAMARGMAPHLESEANGNVRFSAGWGYMGYMSGGVVSGFMPPTVAFIPGYGFVPRPVMSALPPLASQQPVVVDATGVTSGEEIVPCPRDRAPANVQEQSACNDASIDVLYRAAARGDSQ